jgi:hypothetical protein
LGTVGGVGDMRAMLLEGGSSEPVELPLRRVVSCYLESVFTQYSRVLYVVLESGKCALTD